MSIVDISDQSPDPVLGAIAQHTAGDVRSATPAELGVTVTDLISHQLGGPYAFLPDVVSGTPGHPITFDAAATCSSRYPARRLSCPRRTETCELRLRPYTSSAEG